MYLHTKLDNMKLLIEHAPSDQEAYFDNPTLSDVKIILADRTIHAHRIILCRSSGYFRELLTGGFIVGPRDWHTEVDSTTERYYRAAMQAKLCSSKTTQMP